MGAGILRRFGRSRKRLALAIVCAASLLCAAVCFLLLQNVRGCLITQSAAEAWRGESAMRFSQVSAFLPQDAPLDLQGVYTLRQQFAQSFAAESLTAPEGGSLSRDAYCAFGSVNVFTDRTSLTAKAVGVGGDFFFFHPLLLRSGGYISENDFMSDRVVLDEDLAWTLFGSFDVAGQSVCVGTRQFLVAGVVHREDDFATKAAYADGAGLFMSYEALERLTEAPICCYETVMPDPVAQYAKNMLTENLPTDRAAVVENTGRFSALRLFSVLGSFAKRSMNQAGIVYPYWENAARYCEDYAALLLLLLLVFLIFPVCMTVFLAVHWGRYYFREGKEKLRSKLERRIEDNKKKHYKREGL